MKYSDWREIVGVLTLPSCACPHFGLLAKRFKVSEDTLCSIYSQENQRRIIQSSQRFQQQAPRIHREYLSGVPFLDLCACYNWPACYLVRRLLELPPFSLGRQRITEVLRNPKLVLESKQLEGVQEPEWTLRKQQMLLDVQTALLCDPSNSPAADITRRELGLQYEAVLNAGLQELGLAFWTEEALRSKGFFKTPDAKLQVPFMIGGRMVSWIDSKACFGGEYMHQEQTQNQYQKYVNRYGPGMVVYWFGVLDELAHSDKDVIVVSKLPDAADCVCLPRLDMAGS